MALGSAPCQPSLTAEDAPAQLTPSSWHRPPSKHSSVIQMRRPKRTPPAKEKRSLWEVVTILVFPGIFIVAGLALLWAGSAEWRHARASASWPTTAGIVETSSSSMVIRRLNVRIVYTYEVRAIAYRSGRVAFGSYSPTAGLRWLKQYPVGALVKVHFDPRNPAISVLEPRLVEGNWVMPSFGALFLAAGCLMGRFFWRSLRSG